MIVIRWNLILAKLIYTDYSAGKFQKMGTLHLFVSFTCRCINRKIRNDYGKGWREILHLKNEAKGLESTDAVLCIDFKSIDVDYLQSYSSPVLQRLGWGTIYLLIGAGSAFDLAQCILGWRGLKFIQMKGPALFQGEIITK